MEQALAALVGSLMGLGKGIGGDLQTQRDYRLAENTQRFSPWTGLKANEVKDRSMIGEILAGLGAGAQMGAGLNGTMGGLSKMFGGAGGTNAVSNVVAGSGGASPNLWSGMNNSSWLTQAAPKFSSLSLGM